MSYKRLAKEKSTTKNTKIVYNENGFAIMSKELVDMLLQDHNRLWQLENKIENGTLIELPCKVGDRIWAILGNSIFGRKVKSIVIRGDGYTIKTSNTNGWKDLETYINSEFNVKWFLTKAEAENKLKELQKNDL